MRKRRENKKSAAGILALLAAAALAVSGCSGGNTAAGSSEKAGGSITGITAEGASEDAAGTDTADVSGTLSKSADKNKTVQIGVTLSGGTGKASVESPAEAEVDGDTAEVKIVFSSEFYDYMIVDGGKYLNESEAGEHSSFTIPVNTKADSIDVTADTTAMSQPHEIEYTLTFDWNYSGEAGSDQSGHAATGSTSEAVQSENSSGTSGIEGSGTGSSSGEAAKAESSGTNGSGPAAAPEELGGLKRTGQLDLQYAQQFSVNEYGDDGLTLITIGEDRFLLVPEGSGAPSGLSDDFVILQEPLQNIYLVSSSVMDYFQTIDALDTVRLSGTKESDWSILEAKKAMSDGDILYAGKYNAPDYELILNEGCGLAIENTMIYHNPDVKEKLESLGIPVMVERSSYESDPRGRLEWIRLYGVMTGHETEADQFFEQETKKIDAVMNQEKTGKTVAFFYLKSNGGVSVRRPGDYISKMIEMAGGTYVLQETDETQESSSSTMNMQMEDFYSMAKDADILIYNSTIDGEVTSIQDLENKSSLFKDFKAVKNKDVYCTEQNFFQQPTGIGDFIEDLGSIFRGSDGDLTYIFKLK